MQWEHDVMSYFDDTDDSEALRLWQERLEAYLGGQEGVEGLRSRVQPNPPWPDSDNPMLGYLLARAVEIHEADGLEMALTWVAVHAVDTRAELIRHLGA